VKFAARFRIVGGLITFFTVVGNNVLQEKTNMHDSDDVPHYFDDGSESASALVFQRRRLLYRPGPFGIRLESWYEPGLGDPLIGSAGGSPGFVIVPNAIQAQNSSDLGKTVNARSRLGSTTIPGLECEYFVDGGILWVPFGASIYWDWPDKQAANNGTLSHSRESWDGEFGTGTSSGLCFTRYLANNQVIALSRRVRRAVCSSPFGILALPGGLVMSSGVLPVTLAGGLTVQMLFTVGIDARVTALPVTFYYTF
jgi:hypothetical protein